MTRPRTTSLALAALLIAAAGCGDKGGTAPVEPPATLPAGLLVTAAPADPVGVGAAYASAKTGDRLVVRGRIGGTLQPFVPRRAVMTIADTDNLTDCTRREGDTCKRPWDYCCEEPKTIQANIATVLVADGAGHPLKVDLENAGGMKPLAVVVVEGTVTRSPAGNNLEIAATKIYVEP